MWSKNIKENQKFIQLSKVYKAPLTKLAIKFPIKIFIKENKKYINMNL